MNGDGGFIKLRSQSTRCDTWQVNITEPASFDNLHALIIDSCSNEMYNRKLRKRLPARSTKSESRPTNGQFSSLGGSFGRAVDLTRRSL